MKQNLVWHIGAIKITRLLELENERAPDQPLFVGSKIEDIMREEWLFPQYCRPDGGLKFSIHALLIEMPNFRLVVDTCIGDSKSRSVPHYNNLDTGFLDRMIECGWHPDSVDAVICTHMHFDHVGWNTRKTENGWVPTFKNAKYYFARREYENFLAELHSLSPDGNTQESDLTTLMDDSIRPVFEAGLAHLVDLDAEITSGVRLLPTPGHTEAHVSVMLESQGQKAIITGDLMHHPIQMVHPDWIMPIDWNAAVATVTRRDFVTQFAGTDVLVIGTHFPAPTAGYIVNDANGIRLKT